MTPDDHRRLRYQARAKTSQLLLEQTATLGEEAIETAALGVIAGVGEFLKAYLGERLAYECMQRAADELLRKPDGDQA